MLSRGLGGQGMCNLHRSFSLRRTARQGIATVIEAVFLCIVATGAEAYTSAGDRLFPATLVLPQAAPSDQFFVTPTTQPFKNDVQATSVTEAYDKTITPRLGVQLSETEGWGTKAGEGSTTGPHNFVLALKYLVDVNKKHEFFFTVAVDHEFGNTGGGSAPHGRGATLPTVYFGKGLGDLDIGYLRPLAIVGYARYQISDGAPRPDGAALGFALEYSIPYLQSKVKAFDIPDPLRRITPLVECLISTPIGRDYGTGTNALIAPGISYKGEGWEAGVEALVPVTSEAGSGVGAIAQVNFSLDYLFSTGIGEPLFHGR